mmetsp:Transcript_47877/g.110955  ORF Transcript_47877/g.110955 Transcript_47877/m.110955 type:complete len:206 (-) Transcript_47877:48-665(-)
MLLSSSLSALSLAAASANQRSSRSFFRLSSSCWSSSSSRSPLSSARRSTSSSSPCRSFNSKARSKSSAATARAFSVLTRSSSRLVRSSAVSSSPVAFASTSSSSSSSPATASAAGGGSLTAVASLALREGLCSLGGGVGTGSVSTCSSKSSMKTHALSFAWTRAQRSSKCAIRTMEPGPLKPRTLAVMDGSSRTGALPSTLTLQT